MKKVSVPITAICLALSVSICVAELRIDLITSGKDNYWKEADFTEESGNANVTVNETQKFQNWQGFAGTFNEAGWEALKKLSSSDRDKAMKLLFDAKDGIGFTWGRIPIGASDYALKRYTLSETSDDFEMEHFSISRDKDYLIPYIKAAQAVKSDIRFWASPWTPPTWMKTGAADAAGFDGGVMKNEDKYLKAHALYFARFIEAYNGEGIPIDAVCPQNEPGYTQNYPSCGWGKYRKPDNNDVNGNEYLSTFVADYLVPKLKSSAPKTDIWFGTLSYEKFATDHWNAAKSKAGQDIKGVGLQWNNVNLVANIANAGYLVIQSEHQCGNYPWKSAKANSPEDAHAENFLASMAPNNHAYGEESWALITKWIKAGVHVYSAWNMVLDTKGFNLDKSRAWPQNALLAVDMESGKLKITPAYYVFRHIAQYVDTGAVRLGTQGGDALAFLNPDGGIITIVYNSGNQTQMTIAVGGKKLKFTVPAKGWATLCLRPPATSAKEISHSQSQSGLRVISKRDGYTIALPSRESGHLELLSLTGQVLESRDIQQGAREIRLQKQASHTGMLLVRVMYGSGAQTARILNF